MTGLHLAVSLAFGAIGIAITYCGHRMWNSEKDMRMKRRQVQARIDADNERRHKAVEVLDQRLEAELALFSLDKRSVSVSAIRYSLECVYFEWLSGQGELFYVVGDDNVRLTTIHNGTFGYELPENIRKFKRKKKK